MGTGTLGLSGSGSNSNTGIIFIFSNAVFDVSGTGGFVLGTKQTLAGNGAVVGNVGVRNV